MWSMSTMCIAPIRLERSPAAARSLTVGGFLSLAMLALGVACDSGTVAAERRTPFAAMLFDEEMGTCGCLACTQQRPTRTGSELDGLSGDHRYQRLGERLCRPCVVTSKHVTTSEGQFGPDGIRRRSRVDQRHGSGGIGHRRRHQIPRILGSVRSQSPNRVTQVDQASGRLGAHPVSCIERRRHRQTLTDRADPYADIVQFRKRVVHTMSIDPDCIGKREWSGLFHTRRRCRCRHGGAPTRASHSMSPMPQY